MSIPNPAASKAFSEKLGMHGLVLLSVFFFFPLSSNAEEWCSFKCESKDGCEDLSLMKKVCHPLVEFQNEKELFTFAENLRLVGMPFPEAIDKLGSVGFHCIAPEGYIWACGRPNWKANCSSQTQIINFELDPNSEDILGRKHKYPNQSEGENIPVLARMEFMKIKRISVELTRDCMFGDSKRRH
jgi:hypothetical protein